MYLSGYSQQTFKYKVVEAPEWNNVFKRTSGWFGADGIFTVPLNTAENKPPRRKTKHFFWFSDTMIGELENNKPRKSKMIHNSVALMNGTEADSAGIKFSWNTKAQNPETIFIPNTASAKPGDYYWLGDGFYNRCEKKIYIFAYRMHNTDPNDDWSFQQKGIDIITIPVKNKTPLYNNHSITEVPEFIHHSGASGEISWGVGMYSNTKQSGAPKPDGYIYIYGTKGKNKQLIVARVKANTFKTFAGWQFWNGKEWGADVNSAKAISANVSNELSVSLLPNGKYALIYLQGGMGENIVMQAGDSPVGPFSEPMILYITAEGKLNKNYFTYNAKAHPSLSKKGELLISYNVNSFNFFKEIKENATLYRPRFIKLVFEK